MKRIILTAALAASPFAGIGAQAQTPDVVLGPYVGAAITQSRWDEEEFDVVELDDEDNSWKAMVGWRFHPNFAAELDYVDFGETSAPITPLGERFNAEAKAWAVYAVGLIPISTFDIYGKLGAAWIDGEGRFGDVAFEDDATEFAYGVGARWRIENFGVQLEYEKFDTDVVGDLDLLSLGVTYTFDMM